MIRRGPAVPALDRQLTDLFTVARVAEEPDFRNAADGSFKNGLTEAAVVSQWVDAFNASAKRCGSRPLPHEDAAGGFRAD